MKAGYIVSGEFSVEQALKKGKVHLVILAKDASDNTKKKFRDKCRYRSVPLLEISNKTDLGRAIGKEMRASLAITDKGFAETIESQWR